MRLTPAEIDAMPIEERLKLLDTLWDSILDGKGPNEIPDWRKKRHDENLERLKSQPGE